MQEKEWIFADGSLYYETEPDGVRILRYQGFGSQVTVPEQIEGFPVKKIGKKAFLSRKNLRRVILPDSVEEIGDWAFAYCDRLWEAFLPDRAVRFGKAVFLECSGLKRIVAGDEEAFPAELLAAAVTVMDAPYLLDMEAAGTDEWLEKWDARLAGVLHASDQEGYSRQILCGEEDYGSTDLDAYTSGRRRVKAALSFLRLLFPRGLSESLKQELEEYLRSHTKGEAGEEAWQVILKEHGTHREYYRLFAELSCVTEENLNGILADIGETYPEMKAFFLRYREEKLAVTDFFEGLEL